MTAVAALDPGIASLIRSDEPVIAHRALVDLDRADPDDRRVLALRRRIPAGRLVSALMAGQEADGGFGRHPYSKWTGGHWRLVSLMDLGVPADLPGAPAAIEPVLGWLLGTSHRSNIPTIAGLPRRCASQEGNALAVAVHFGLADDPRVALLADSLVSWQWPDGGWNCDRREAAHHSSFHETLPAYRGIAAFARATGDRAAAMASDHAAEFVLRHRVAYRERTGRPLGPDAVRIHYPPYWHYDFLAGLRVLAESGHVTDPRTADALDLLESKRRADGAWAPDRIHFRRPGSASLVDVADWARPGQVSQPATLGALLVLRAAGRS
jgi:hypothetical protein